MVREDILPNDDPHISEFLAIPPESRLFQSKIGYCFQPLIKHIYDELGDDLAFVVLMYSPQKLTPSASMKNLKFCAFNNRNPSIDSQLRFRKILRFVGTSRFTQTSVQTSKILFEKRGGKSISRDDNCRAYIYSQEQRQEADSDIQVVPVGPLLSRVLESAYFSNLQKFLTNANPETIWNELTKQFERFYNDGDLEKWVLSRPEERARRIANTSILGAGNIDNDSLFAFEQLLETFGLRSSKDLRRRFLNYLLWMLLCDERTQSYSYVGALDHNVPRGELVIVSRENADYDLVLKAKNVVMQGFRKIFALDPPWKERRPTRASRYNRSKKSGDSRSDAESGVLTELSTISDERKAVNQYTNSKKWSGPDTKAEVNAIFGLDETLLNYVGPILTNTFLSPHEQLSLDPFWSEDKKDDQSMPYLADLTHSALTEEFSLYQSNLDAFQRAIDGNLLYRFKQPSRVNPFLMAMSPIADYLSKELKSLRKLAIDSNETPGLNLANRSLGESPLEASGLLSLNIVFWDIATSRFRYCSLSFINGDEVFEYAFKRFFRLIETGHAHVNEPAENRGILQDVLLMSDILFRTQKGKIEPVCIAFEDQQTFPEGTNVYTLPVSEYIKYLNDEDVHHVFNQMYVKILQESDPIKQQKIFKEFCSDERAVTGVWDFLRNGRGKYNPKNLNDRTTAFLRRYGVDPITTETIAQFLAYITWLWLCYQERPAYYYYIPSQLPFDERVGGFAIASEIPIPSEILDFLFVSVAPRIVSYPALLHHREADTKLSRALLHCWFDSLLHIIANSYGLKELGQDLSAMDSRLTEIQQSCGSEVKDKIEEIRAVVRDAQKQMQKIPDLEADLKRIFGERQSADAPLKLSDVLTLSLRFSRWFVQKRQINIISPEPSDHDDQFKVHSPLVLVLWHLILNASKAVGNLPANVERKIEILTEVDSKGGQVIISVRNPASLDIDDRPDRKENWKGLKKDENVLEALWHKASPGMRPEKVLTLKVTTVDGLAQVEVKFSAPEAKSIGAAL